MKSALRDWRAVQRWRTIGGPCADADFPLVPVSLS